MALRSRPRACRATRWTIGATDVIQIRDETPADVDEVRHVNEALFGEPDEARLVDLVRTNGGVLLSLVATVDAC